MGVTRDQPEFVVHNLYKAFKYRIFPTKEQEQALAIQFGHARFIYNWGLEQRIKSYKETRKGITCNDTQWALTKLKKHVAPWLYDADAQVLKQKLVDLDRAYKNFFEKHSNYPKFKSKKSKQSIRYTKGFRLVDDTIRLPKIGFVKIIIHRPIEGKQKNCTVTKTKSGEYYVSILCEVEVDLPGMIGDVIGVDLGLKHFAILSKPLNGNIKIEHPQYLRKTERKLAIWQRRLARRNPDSKRWHEAKLKVIKLHEKVARQRADFLHKLSFTLTNEFGKIYIEDLNVQGMLKNHKLAKSIADSGWPSFVNFCSYKAPWYGAKIEKRDRFFPSSKLCSVCGFKNNLLELHHRFWKCPSCATNHDRDLNAAINIELGQGPVRSHAKGDYVNPYSVFA